MNELLSGSYIYFVLNCLNFRFYLSRCYYRTLKLWGWSYYLSCWSTSYSFLYLLNLLYYFVDLTVCICLVRWVVVVLYVRRVHVYPIKGPICYKTRFLIQSHLNFSVYNTVHRKDCCYLISIGSYCLPFDFLSV